VITRSGRWAGRGVFLPLPGHSLFRYTADRKAAAHVMMMMMMMMTTTKTMVTARDENDESMTVR